MSTINRKPVGWANYFSLGPVSKAYRAIDQYTIRRLRAGGVGNTGKYRFADDNLYEERGLVRLASRTHDFP